VTLCLFPPQVEDIYSATAKQCKRRRWCKCTLERAGDDCKQGAGCWSPSRSNLARSVSPLRLVLPAVNLLLKIFPPPGGVFSPELPFETLPPKDHIPSPSLMLPPRKHRKETLPITARLYWLQMKGLFRRVPDLPRSVPPLLSFFPSTVVVL